MKSRCRPGAALWTLSIAIACASMTQVNARKTTDYRELSYRSIGPADEPVDESYRRTPLSEEQGRTAWETMRGLLIPKRWEFADVEGLDLVVSFGVGRASGDGGPHIGPDTFVVDVFERTSGKRVWYGWAQDMKDPTSEEIEQALNQILLHFPEIPPRPAAY